MSASDYLPIANLQTLRQRAQLLTATRQFFSDHGYWEVDTPHLSADACIDAWIDPVILPQGVTDNDSTLYLQTSPEFAMKRLLAAGADAIYQLGHVFRAGESGRRHNPEFTMLEWYQAGATFQEQMTFTEALVRHIAQLPIADCQTIALPERFERLSYDEVFERAIGQRVLHLTTSELVELAGRLRVVAPESLDREDRDGWLNLLLVERVEPWMDQQPALFMYDYPDSQSALARVRPDSPPVAERFELYLHGIELCNGYQELTDGHELLRRMRHQNELRKQAGRPLLKPTSRLVDAQLAGAFPESSGVALGFDRMVMWRLGKELIADVIPFPTHLA